MAEDNELGWRLMPEATTFVRDAVKRWHKHLDGATIVTVGRPTAQKKGGKLVWGQLKLPSPMERALFGAEVDYLLILALDIWAQLGDDKRRALVDHELCHGGGWDSEAEAWTMVAHDIEEFAAVIARHGLWKNDVQLFFETIGQMELGLDTAGDAETKAHLRVLVERLRPKPGSGLESVTLSSAGRSTTLHADGRTETI